MKDLFSPKHLYELASDVAERYQKTSNLSKKSKVNVTQTVLPMPIVKLMLKQMVTDGVMKKNVAKLILNFLDCMSIPAAHAVDVKETAKFYSTLRDVIERCNEDEEDIDDDEDFWDDDEDDDDEDDDEEDSDDYDEDGVGWDEIDPDDGDDEPDDADDDDDEEDSDTDILGIGVGVDEMTDADKADIMNAIINIVLRHEKKEGKKK